MTISQGKVVSIHYTLKNTAGEIIDSSDGSEPLGYLHGAQNIIPGLEAALEGKVVGDELNVVIEAKDAYGERDDTKVQAVSKDMFEEGTELKAGAEFYAAGPDGEHITITIKEVNDDEVVVDGNHPLAGETLHFDVKVMDIREASAEETEHGHVHGPGGHHH